MKALDYKSIVGAILKERLAGPFANPSFGMIITKIFRRGLACCESTTFLINTFLNGKGSESNIKVTTVIHHRLDKHL